MYLLWQGHEVSILLRAFPDTLSKGLTATNGFDAIALSYFTTPANPVAHDVEMQPAAATWLLFEPGESIIRKNASSLFPQLRVKTTFD